MLTVEHKPTRTFDETLELVHVRAANQLPDRIVHIADMRMLPEGRFTTGGADTFRLNSHSRRQLASLVGVRWDTWFRAAISGAERADELNRRLTRMPGELKIRAYRDDTHEADGVIRGLLGPKFTPIDDDRIFDTLAETMKGPLDEYEFTQVAFTDSTSHYRALHRDFRDVEDDRHRPGFALRNSEVGSAALSLDDFWLRLVCLNGLMLPVDGKRLLYRTHRAIEDEQLAAAMVIAISRLPKRWDVVANMLVGAKHEAVPHPDDAVLAALDGVVLPKALVDGARETVLRDGDPTRFGVVQAITAVARERTTDPDQRFSMERAAGDYLAAA
jgi:hypothetical protein